MKKIFLITTILSTIGLLAAMPAAAATFSFSPSSVNVAEGEDFNLTATINPQGVKNYTVKLELDYPADLLEVKSFSFSSGWMAVSQPGYDSIDNTNGLLIKTGGYAGGVLSNTTLGTVVFSAKKAGNAVVKTMSNSLALDAENQNVLTGSPQIAVNIAAAVVSTPPSPPGAPTVVSTPAPSAAPAGSTATEPNASAEEPQEGAEVPQEGETISITTTDLSEGEIAEVQPTTEQRASFLARVGNFISLGTGSTMIGIIMVLIVLTMVIVVVRGIRLKRNPR